VRAGQATTAQVLAALQTQVCGFSVYSVNRQTATWRQVRV